MPKVQTSGKPQTRRYSDEEKAAAERMVRALRAELGIEHGTCSGSRRSWATGSSGPSRPGPWRSVEDVELATLGWVHWHNHQQQHGLLGNLPPVEFEWRSHATTQGHEALVDIT